jgi:hypothetical protein
MATTKPTPSKPAENGPQPEDLKEDVGRENLKALGDLVGPAVRLYYYDPVHYIWYGSVLVACHTSLFGQQAPLLNYKTTETEPTDVVGEIILNHAEWSVVRCCRPHTASPFTVVPMPKSLGIYAYAAAKDQIAGSV